MAQYITSHGFDLCVAGYILGEATRWITLDLETIKYCYILAQDPAVNGLYTLIPVDPQPIFVDANHIGAPMQEVVVYSNIPEDPQPVFVDPAHVGLPIRQVVVVSDLPEDIRYIKGRNCSLELRNIVSTIDTTFMKPR